MQLDNRIFFLTADIGYGIFDSIERDFPNRFINVGASEQALIGASVGLALSGNIPIAFTITPFLLYRPFEFIRNYLNHEQISVKLVGSGRNKDYSNQGFTHWASEDTNVMNVFQGIKCFYPNKKEELFDIAQDFFYNDKPCYLNLKRQG